jgi:hypothetical protein
MVFKASKDFQIYQSRFLRLEEGTCTISWLLIRILHKYCRYGTVCVYGTLHKDSRRFYGTNLFPLK